jgi:large subunit ribosomal protein L15
MEKKQIKIKHSAKGVEPKKALLEPLDAKQKNKVPAEKILIKKEPLLKTAVFGLHSLEAPRGAHKGKKLLGRGPGSGHGKTSTRGSKGQTSRSGRDFYLGFEGGQTPLIRRIPKRGFTSNFRKDYQTINLDQLNLTKETVITPAVLEERGLIKNKERLVKILGQGQVKRPVTVCAHAFSKNAEAKLKSSGSKIEVINA